jgi:hypothetical protein
LQWQPFTGGPAFRARSRESYATRLALASRGAGGRQKCTRIGFRPAGAEDGISRYQ